MKAAMFAADAMTWIGVPWHHQGRNRFGVDCVGLPIGILVEAGVPIRARQNYGRMPMQELVSELERWCQPASGPAVGVMVAFHWPQQTLPGHLGILVDVPQGLTSESGFYLIHAHLRAKRVVLNAYGHPWADRTLGFWLAPGVQY
jgi:cell wall-associated NlpC family hydrolase